MKHPYIVRADWLRRQEACEKGIAAFERTFGAWAELTPANILWAAHEGLDLDWLARALPLAWGHDQAIRKATHETWVKWSRATTNAGPSEVAECWVTHQRSVAEALIAVLFPASTPVLETAEVA